MNHHNDYPSIELGDSMKQVNIGVDFLTQRQGKMVRAYNASRLRSIPANLATRLK